MFRKEAFTDYVINHNHDDFVRILMRGDTWREYTIKEYEIAMVHRETLYEEFCKKFNEEYVLESDFEMGDESVDLAGYDGKSNHFDLFRFDIDDRLKDLSGITTFDNWVTEFRECGFSDVQCYWVRFPRCQLKHKKTESEEQFLERVREWAHKNPPIIIPVNGYYIDGFTPF